jgi:uncharacterized protein YndB with AHSA1/START domain
MRWLRNGALALAGLIVLAVSVLLGLGMRKDAGTIAGSIEIARPPKDIWPWLTEPERMKTWIGWLVEVRELTPPPHGVGSMAVWVMEDRHNNNEKMEISDEVVEYEPPRRIRVRFSSARMFDGEGAFTLTELGNGRTRVDQVGEYRFHHWLSRLFLPLIVHSAGAKALEDMERLKSKVEESRPN